MTIAVTGSAGMIGSQLVDKLIDEGYDVVALDRKKGSNQKAVNVVIDLSDSDTLKNIFIKYRVDKVIHLAALAHSIHGQKLTWNDYYKANVECAQNVFEASKDVPLLFISTVDVYGFTKGIVTTNTPTKPITPYGKTKLLAEEACKKLCNQYTIFRLSPVYTSAIKRDIQKRYYLKYPNIAYKIGKGTEYEILNAENATQAMIDWCSSSPKNNVKIIKDSKRMFTPNYIESEKQEGRANIVVRVPQCIVNVGYAVLKGITGENKYTYLLNKAVHPLRSE